MITILSLVTSIKDYLEVVHKFIEYDSVNIDYTELGSIITFFLISIKNCIGDFFNFSWLLKENVWSLPIIIPDISSAMISEISVLDGYFHNTFNFLDTPISYGMPTQNALIVCLEKLTIGIINSFFLFLPTSIAHIITLRRFVMQGLDAGYISGLGTIAGNIFWLASVILGFRFFVIPWLSLDIFRYVLGFILLVKYMWDSYNERKMVLEDVSKRKIFLLNFLLALTEQTSIYPFISNISISPEASILETVPSLAFGEGGASFIVIHLAYLLGIALGSLSLLHFSCWFWENPAFKLYMWVISSFKVSTSLYYKVLNFTFLYLTMLSAVCSIPYYGLDYTITNPLGYVSDDRIIQDKVVLETSFLGSKASDRNTRRNRGRHGRRERWKRRIRKYRTFDASLYDQGIYDLFTIEDLNYGFDRFWLRRKLRNHRVRFRFFPGPWMRSFKKQLAKPRLESFTGPRVEFFRILFEQVYHPSFHAYQTNLTPTNSNLSNMSMSNMSKNPVTISILKEENKISKDKMNNNLGSLKGNENIYAINSKNISSSLYLKNKNFTSLLQKATLKKFIRKFENRVKTSQIMNLQNNDNIGFSTSVYPTSSSLAVLSNSNTNSNGTTENSLPNFNLTALNSIKQKNKISTLDSLDEKEILLLNNSKNPTTSLEEKALKKQRTNISRKDSQILQYRSLLTNSAISPASQGNEPSKANKANFVQSSTLFSTKPEATVTQKQNKNYESLMLLHPLKFYVQQETAFKRKLRYYSPNIFRKFSVENNAPYFRVMMKRYFYNYKPNLRWERTLKAASLRKARRKTTRIPKQLQKSDFSNFSSTLSSSSANVVSTATSAISVPLGEKREAIEGKDSVFGDKIVTPLEKAAFQKSTYNYSVVSKRANRYRYQIYKDVLQHWYYSPFNRFLLKLDVDSFIRRQPNAHFLTAKEENLLHLRRFLLSEHYNTLRWYTNMEHYRSMKTQLNSGVKSFSSRAYNQQFSGTFKKVRHLFAITPSISTASSSPFNSLSQLLSNATSTRSPALDNKDSKDSKGSVSFPSFPSGERGKETKEEQKITNVLKFDQPLYNEYPTGSSMAGSGHRGPPAYNPEGVRGNEVLPPLLNPLVIHEELLPEFYGTSTQLTQSTEEQKEKQQQNALNLNNDLLSQSQNIVRQYLIQTRSVREEYIKQLLKENNYSELTQFIYKGQKLRGNEPVTNQKLLNNQEKNYLLTAAEKAEIENSLSDKISSFSDKSDKNGTPTEKEFYLTYLKNWKRRVNDQESLKNYLTRRFEKREKRKQKKEKQLLSKLNRLESWLSISDESYSIQSGSNQSYSNKYPESMNLEKTKFEPLADSLLTTGLQKSILDGMFVLNNVDTKVVSLNEKNLWKVLLLSKIKGTRDGEIDGVRKANLVNSPTFVRLQDLSLHFSDLKNIQKLKLSNEIKTTVQTTREFLQSVTNDKNNKKKVGVYSSLKNKIANNLSPKNYTKISSKISNFTKLCLNSAKTAKNKYLNLSKLTDLLKPIKRKSLNDWRKKERVLSKQKRSRKEFKLLNKKSESVSTFIDSSGLLNSYPEAVRAQDVTNELDLALQVPSRKKRDQNNNDSNSNNSTEPSFISYAFKRKRTPQRRSRIRRNRGVFKKRTLSDSLRKDFSQYLNEKEINSKLQDDKTLKQSLPFERKTAFALFSKGTTQDQEVGVGVTPSFPSGEREELGEKENILLKQRKAKQRKERFWKQKRSKYSQKRRKYRKRRRYTVVKIRNLNKQFKRIKNQIEIQNWWWQQFIPSIQASNEALWQIEKDKLIQQKLSQLSTSDILERDSLNLNNQAYNTLQIGKKDFKPLALPEAIRLKQENSSVFSENVLAPNSYVSTNENEDLNNFNVLNKLYESLFIQKNSEIQQNSLFKEFLLPNTNLPFYTGWDESLRKLIITNRMLSRKDAGFTIPNNQTLSSQFSQGNDLLKENAEQEQLEYTLAPLQGMNAATTLYWQIPFTTYDPDQFFALGMDGFSPIGWRKFLFRHSILKTWLTNKETYSTSSTSTDALTNTNINGFEKTEQKQPLGLVIKTQNNPLTWGTAIEGQPWGNLDKEESRSLFSLSQPNKFKQQKKAFAISRRLKKRYRRVKKHPRTPVWFPSGPLLNQVLPVHYIYVFYKRARLPRDRYLKRRLLNVKTLNNNSLSFNLIKQNSQIALAEANEANGVNSTSFYDFTLRKRLKPKRKYHLKRDYYASNVIIPRRFKFMSISSSSKVNEALPQKEIAQSTYVRKWRPLSSLKIHKPIADVVKEQLLLRKSAVLREQKQRSSKQPNIRVKQLRRRVQRQILRSVWRYRPRAGGFVWPGDYLKLELVKAPKLQSPSIKDKDKEFNNYSLAAMDLRSTGIEANVNKEVDKKEKTKKQKRKKKRTLVEWQIQPKKYLYDKHNLKVLKKKLHKAKRSFDYTSNTLIPTLNVLRNSINAL